MRPTATTSVTNQPLTAAQAARFERAAKELQAGRPEPALEIARQLSRDAVGSADAHQLLGMCASECGLVEVAEKAFVDALKLAPAHPLISLNFATWLRRRGRSREALAVLSQAEESPQVKVQQGLLALELQDPATAVQALRRATSLQPESVVAWHGLGCALRDRDDLSEADVAFRRTISLAPRHVPAWINLGAVLRLRGRLNDAMSVFRQAEAFGSPAPELQDAIAGLLADMGNAREAITRARQLCATHPEFPQGHETLANLLWEHGEKYAPGEDPLGGFAESIHRHPAHRLLKDRYVYLLLAARRAAEALPIIEQDLRSEPDNPFRLWQAATAFDDINEHSTAGLFFAKAHRLLGGSNREFLNAYARHAFKVGRMELAETCASTVIAQAPDDQEAWAHLGTAWRLRGDARERWLCDYEQLVGFVEVPAPPRFGSTDEFLGSLTQELSALHIASREPVKQSVRGGSQTSGRLFGRESPLLAVTQHALSVAVERWIEKLPEDPRHPFLSRKTRSGRIVGSWSVKLRSSGRHSNHIHPLGWMSSAFYVSLPPTVKADSPDQAGWIQFGQPLEELGLGLAPRRLVQPKPGYLALFPSYFWHGTVPFVDTEPRLTIAFDMQPL